MSAPLWWNVCQFMRKFRQHVPVPFRPTRPSDEEIRRRLQWTFEEAFEILDVVIDPIHDEDFARARVAVERLLENMTIRPVIDLAHWAKENADLRYIAYGNDVVCGIVSAEIDYAVHESNMTKSHAEPSGKVQKGAHYRAPDIVTILKNQF